MVYYGLLSASARALRCSLQDEVPNSIASLPFGELVYQRELELMAEFSNAISGLCRAGYLRPAYAVLRSLLENMATLVWASQSERYMTLFNEGHQTNMREILRRIGWEDEYERTFSLLSQFVHADLNQADFYRRYETVSADEPFPEVRPDGDYYVIQTPDEVWSLAILPMNYEEAEAAYGPYISSKTLDIVLSGLKILLGVDDDQRPTWWPLHEIGLLEWLCSQDPELNDKMIWCSR